MIKEIFLPQTIKGYYFFGQRIVGFDIGKAHVTATQIYLKGRSTTIEKYFNIALDPGTPTNYNERVSKAIAEIASQLDNYDAIHTALSSSLVIFKELRLPFLAYEKLQMVVPYEIEPLLPFAPGDAVIDFVITRQNTEHMYSEILAAAVQNQHIANHIQLFKEAGISPDVITIDLLGLYGLYSRISQHTQQPGNIILMDLEHQSTRIAFIQDNQLRFIRTLNKGTLQIAKTISETLNMQPQESMEHLLRYGFEKSTNQKFVQVLNQEYELFLNDIQLIIQSFISQANQSIHKIMVAGPGVEINGIVPFMTSYMQIPCQAIQSADITNAGIGIKNKATFPSANIVSLGTALPCAITQEFNLRKNSFATQEDTLLDKQLITAGGLFLTVFLGLSINSYLQIQNMKNAALNSEKEALDTLLERKNFRRSLEEGLKGIKEKDKLEEALTLAIEEVKKTRGSMVRIRRTSSSFNIKILA